MSSIYIAAPWARKADGEQVRDDLKALGYLVTSSWLDEPDSGGTGIPDDPALCQEMARRDFEDISAADTLLVLTDSRPIGAGHHVELGWALASSLTVVVAGPIKSIFHHLADRIYPSWSEAKSYFEKDAT